MSRGTGPRITVSDVTVAAPVARTSAVGCAGAATVTSLTVILGPSGHGGIPEPAEELQGAKAVAAMVMPIPRVPGTAPPDTVMQRRSARSLLIAEHGTGEGEEKCGGAWRILEHG
jgi:hypothetical protein